MAAGAAAKERRKKKKKTDKWGQPVVALVEDAEQGREENPSQRDAEEQVEEEEAAAGGGESYDPNKVVVSGMPYSATEQQIRDLFRDIGPIVQLQLSRFPDSGNFRGLAFVTFQTEEMVTNSLDLDGIKMGNRFVKVERCRLCPQRKRKFEFLDEPKKVDGCFSAYVGNLSWDVTEDDIRDCFKDSKISSVRFALDKRTGQSRGFCHIDFKDDESLEEAMKKNQFEFLGRPMKIAYAISNRN
ncbi:hypothetical protein OPV22_001201 [Ensete ventricosum]|uniref:RRM domain-containing protein n=1 Tax=Ensete ventricosum TaxID=4639 RepID=A0AAV8RU67_ENSVE|nr:hypothetical protein OPV22_001201 [Ensete ventricosum]